MDKRTFLMGAGASAWAAAGATQSPAAAAVAGTMRILTVAGRTVRANRGPLDPVRDQLMKKHGADFKRAHAFGLPDLLRMSPVRLQPTLEYDGKTHTLRGPALVDVLEAAGVDLAGQVGLRALDGYRVVLTLAQVRERGVILATHMDDRALEIGGLGPLWAVFDPARVPHLREQPLAQRYADCPWGAYFIDVLS